MSVFGMAAQNDSIYECTGRQRYKGTEGKKRQTGFCYRVFGTVPVPESCPKG